MQIFSEFDSSVGSFLAYYYSLMMLIITACCFCYFIGSLVSSPAIAQTLVTFFFVAMAVSFNIAFQCLTNRYFILVLPLSKCLGNKMKLIYWMVKKLFQKLLSGFLSNLGEMDRWISWLSHFSILKYALHVIPL